MPAMLAKSGNKEEKNRRPLLKNKATGGRRREIGSLVKRSCSFQLAHLSLSLILVIILPNALTLIEQQS